MGKQFQTPLDYIDVATRIAEFRGKHPDGSLQQVSVEFTEFAGNCWVVFTAAAYRSPDDPRPGIGTAWEPVPGKTPFTRDSELQNAETAAWGRAIVAALAADTKKGIASADEVRNRQSDSQPSQRRRTEPVSPEQAMEADARSRLAKLIKDRDWDKDTALARFSEIVGRTIGGSKELTTAEIEQVLTAESTEDVWAAPAGDAA